MQPIPNQGKPHLILHIGAMKTGSTALQLYLDKNRSVDGYEYPRICPETTHQVPNHSCASFITSRPMRLRAYRHSHGYRSRSAIIENSRGFFQGKKIFSGEWASTLRPKFLNQFGSFISENLKGDVTIVYFVRNPHEYIWSRIAEWIKNTKKIDARQLRDPQVSFRWNPADVIDLYSRHGFTYDLKMFSYDAVREENKDVVNVFLEGLGLVDNYEPSEVANPTLPLAAVRIGYAAKRLGLVRDRVVNRSLHNALERASRRLNTSPFTEPRGLFWLSSEITRNLNWLREKGIEFSEEKLGLMALNHGAGSLEEYLSANGNEETQLCNFIIDTEDPKSEAVRALQQLTRLL